MTIVELREKRAKLWATMEGFLDTHARHYNLTNARIVLYGDMSLERELRLSSSRRVPQSSSWGERIRGKLQEPWCQQRCGRSYGIPKP